MGGKNIIKLIIFKRFVELLGLKCWNIKYVTVHKFCSIRLQTNIVCSNIVNSESLVPSHQHYQDPKIIII